MKGGSLCPQQLGGQNTRGGGGGIQGKGRDPSNRSHRRGMRKGQNSETRDGEAEKKRTSDVGGGLETKGRRGKTRVHKTARRGVSEDKRHKKKRGMLVLSTNRHGHGGRTLVRSKKEEDPEHSLTDWYRGGD